MPPHHVNFASEFVIKKIFMKTEGYIDLGIAQRGELIMHLESFYIQSTIYKTIITVPQRTNINPAQTACPKRPTGRPFLNHFLQDKFKCVAVA